MTTEIDTPASDAGEEPVGPDPFALGFSLNFMSGRGLLTIRDKDIHDFEVRLLELEIPEISFPFDVTGGAERFKSRRCALRHLVFGISAERLNRVLRAAPLRDNGFLDLKAAVRDGFIEFVGRFAIGDHQADFTFRAALLLRSRSEIYVTFYDTRCYGWLPVPSALLPVYLKRALDLPFLQNNEAGFWTLEPANQFLRELLPRSGWKIPDQGEAGLIAAECARGRLIIVAGPDDDPNAKQLHEREPPLRALRAAEAMGNVLGAEKALGRGDIHRAYNLYREALEDDRGGHIARDRLLQIGAADPELSLETRQLAEEVLAEDPKAVQALLALASIAVRERSFGDAAERYATLAGLARDSRARYDSIAAELAAAEAAAPVDPAGALAAYERAAARARDSVVAYRALFNLRAAQGDYEGSVQAGERLVKLEGDKNRRAEIHRRLGSMCRTHLNDLKKARLHFERALRLTPDDPGALEGLAEVYAARGEPARAASYLARLAEQAEKSGDSHRIATLNLRLGQIWERWLGDLDNASARYHRVLDADPTNRQAQLQLADLAEQRGDTDEARAFYEGLLAIEEESGDPEAVPDLVNAYTRLARVTLAEEGPTHEAVACLERAVELDPRNRVARDELARLLRERGEWTRLIHLLEQSVEQDISSDEIRRSLLHAARIEIEQRRDTEAARYHLEQVLDRTPGDTEALELYIPILERDEEWSTISDRMSAAVNLTYEPVRRANYLLRIAQARDAMGLEISARLRPLEEALACNPFLRSAAEQLVELLRQTTEYGRLASALERLIVASDDPETLVPAFLERANLLQHQLGRFEEAEHDLRQALALEPANVRGWLDLADLLAERGEAVEAREILTRAVADESLPESSRGELHIHLAAIAKQREELEVEADHLQSAIALGHDEESIGNRLLEVFVALERQAEVADLLEAWASERDPEHAASLWMRAAEIRRHELDELPRAVAIYRKLLEQEGPVALGAAAELESIAREQNDLPAVVDALHAQIKNGTSDQLAPLFERLIDCYLDLGDEEAAYAACEQLIGIDNPSFKARTLLAERAERQDDYDMALHHLTAMLSRPATTDSDAEARMHAFRHAAAIAHELRPPVVALLEERFKQEFPDAPPTALERTLGDVLADRGDWERLLVVRRQQLERSVDDEAVERRRQIARLQEEKLGRLEDAVESYRQVVALDPGDLESLRALARLYDTLGQQAARAETLTTLSQRVGEPEEALSIGLDAVRLFRAVGDDDRGDEILREISRRDTVDPDDHRLLETLRERKLVRELVALRERSLEAEPALDERFEDLLRLLVAGTLDASKLARWCERMIELFPDDDRAWRYAVVMHIEHADLFDAWSMPVDVGALIRRWADAREGQERADVLRQLAEHFYESGDDDAAIAVLAEAADAAPESVEILERLIAAHEAREDWPAALVVIERLAQIQPKGAERDEQLRRMIALAERIEDRDTAIRGYGELSQRTDEEIGLLGTLYLRDSRLESLAQLDGALDHLELDVLLEAAPALAGADQWEAARYAYERALAEHPETAALWKEITWLWRDSGRGEELARWRIDWSKRTETEVAVLLRLTGYNELVALGQSTNPGVHGVDLLADFELADMSDPGTSLAVFRAARAVGDATWTERGARALETQLDADADELVDVLRVRVQYELEAGDADRAVDLARRLVEYERLEGEQFLDRALEKSGRTDELVDHLTAKASEGGEDAPAIWFRIAGIESRRDNWQAASAAMEQMPEEARDGEWAELRWTAGEKLGSAEIRADGARRMADRTDEVTERAGWLRRAGRIEWWELGHRDAGRELFGTAHNILPDDAETCHTDAQLMVAEGDLEGARRRLEEGLAVLDGTETARLWLELAGILIATDHKDTARVAVDCAQGFMPKDAALWAELARRAAALDDSDLQRKALAQAYDLDAEAHEQAYFAVLEAIDEWPKLIDLLEARGEQLTGEEAGARYARAGRAARDVLGDQERAIDLLGRAVRLEQTTDLLSETFELSMELERLTMIAALGPPLLRRLDDDSPKRGPFLRTLVDALDHLQLEDDSIEYREALLSLDMATVHDKLVLARHAGDVNPRQAAELMEDAALSATGAERADYLVEAADAWRLLDEEERARALLSEALEVGSDSVKAHGLAIRLLEGEVRMRSIARFIEEKGDEDWASSRRAAIRMELALARLEENRGEAALELLIASADFEKSTYWAPAMERVLTVLDRQRELADLWLSEAEAEKSTWDRDALTQRVEKAVAFFHEDGDPAGELRGLEGLSRLKPEQLELRERIAEVAAQLGDSDKFLAQVAHQLDRATDDGARADLALRYAPVLRNQFQDAEAAADMLVDAFRWAPSVRIAKLLEPALDNQGRGDEYDDLLEEQAPNADPENPEERLELLRKVAQRVEKSDEERAYRLYGEIVEVDRTDEHAREFRRGVAEWTGRWDELVANLRLDAEVEVDRTAEFLLRAADIARDRLEDADLERELLGEVLDATPADIDTNIRLVELCLAADDIDGAANTLMAAQGTASRQVDLAVAIAKRLDDSDAGLTAEAVRDWLVDRHPQSLAASDVRLVRAREDEDVPRLLGELEARLAHPAVFEDDEKIALRVEAGKLAFELGDSAKALQHWTAVLEKRASALDTEAVYNATRIAAEQDEQDTLERALAAAVERRDDLERLAEMAPEEEQSERFEMLARLHDRAGDREESLASHALAVGTALAMLPALSVEALRRHFTAEEKWTDLVELDQKIAAAPQPEDERAAALFEMGNLYRDQLGDHDRATEAFTECVGIEPDHAGAQLALGLLHSAAGRHTAALPLLVSNVDPTDAQTPFGNLLALADTLRATEEDERCVDVLDAILLRDPDRAELHAERAGLLEKLERFEEAEAAWRAFVETLDEKDEPEEVARIRMRLGRAARARGDNATAIEELRKAHKLRPRELEYTTELRVILEAEERWREAAELRVLEAVAADSAADQVAKYHELAKMYVEKLSDPMGAALMFERALAAEPDNVDTLRGLLDMHEQAGDWQKWLVVGERMLAVVSEPELDADFFARLARAYQEASGDPARAREFYGKAAERDPENVEVKQKVKDLAKESGDFASWARAEKELLSLEEDDDAAFTRWHELADVYLKRLNDVPSAVEALEGALALRPQDAALLRRIADTYALDAGTYDKAADLYGRLLAVSPLEPDVVRIRARLAGQMNDTDRAYGYYAALLALIPDDAEARDYVHVCRMARPPAPHRTLTDADRAKGLIHSDQHGPIEEIFAQLARFAELTHPGSLEMRGVSESDRLPVEDDRYVWIKRALDALGSGEMSIYEWSGGGYACETELTNPPSLLLGRPLASAGNRERTFMVARAAELYRTGHVLCARLSDSELRALMAAICLAIEPHADPPGKGFNTVAWAETIGGPMNDDIRGQFAPKVLMYMQKAESLDLGAWRRACLATAARVAMLVTCDIAEALDAMLQMRGFDDLTVDQRLAVIRETPEELDLFRFSLSAEYFESRQRLGLALRRQG